MKVFDENEISARLGELRGWQYLNKSITCEFVFKNFAEALAFVNRTGSTAEEMDHHPDILMHSWNKVLITISTHSAGGVTEKDFELAKKIEKIK